MVMFTGSPVRAVAMPASSQPPKNCDAMSPVQEPFALAERQLVDAVHRHVVADVDVGAAAVAGAAAMFWKDTDSPEPMEASVMPCDHM